MRLAGTDLPGEWETFSTRKIVYVRWTPDSKEAN